MIFYIIILVVIKCINALNLTNSIQMNGSSNQIEKRAVLRDESTKWRGRLFFFYISKKLCDVPILFAHKIISKYTCLNFVRTFVKENARFMYKDSYMYMTIMGNHQKFPHKIFIPRKNADPGRIARETLRALGFDYEHNRPDRYDYLKIAAKNIPKQLLPLFFVQPTTIVNTFGLSYDYRSIMHFGTRELCKCGRKCITTKNDDKLVESVLGKAKMLTFNDAKLVNFQYCLSPLLIRRSKCLNYGYPFGILTNLCLCLRYFTGNKCEYFKGNYDYCNQQNIFYAKKKKKKIILKARKDCYYLIKARDGMRIKFKIMFSKVSYWCSICNEEEHLEVRYKDISVSGAMICPQKSFHKFISQSNMVILHTKFKTSKYYITVYYEEI